MKKIEKNSWFTIGTELLETEGFDKLTIDNLCTLLQVTKGSFYHHFGNVDGYVQALMEYWMRVNTLDIIERVESAKSKLQKDRLLNKLVLNVSHKLELTIRAWAYSNAMVDDYVKRVDEIRLQYLIDLQVEKGVNRKQARDAAMLEYATLVGLQQLFPNLTRADYARLQRTHTKNV